MMPKSLYALALTLACALSASSALAQSNFQTEYLGQADPTLTSYIFIHADAALDLHTLNAAYKKGKRTPWSGPDRPLGELILSKGVTIKDAVSPQTFTSRMKERKETPAFIFTRALTWLAIENTLRAFQTDPYLSVEPKEIAALFRQEKIEEGMQRLEAFHARLGEGVYPSGPVENPKRVNVWPKNGLPLSIDALTRVGEKLALSVFSARTKLTEKERATIRQLLINTSSVAVNVLPENEIKHFRLHAATTLERYAYLKELLANKSTKKMGEAYATSGAQHAAFFLMLVPNVYIYRSLQDVEALAAIMDGERELKRGCNPKLGGKDGK